MKISFALLCHDETDSLNQVLRSINGDWEYDYEIVVVYDNVGHQPTTDILNSWQNGLLNVYERPLNGDFSAQKNFMTEKCTGDWIFNLDADEFFPEYLLENVHLIIEQNDTETLWIPRINTVEGMTREMLPQFGMQMNERGWINWPDPQQRIYKNDYPRIHWERPVHERIVGYKTYSILPYDDLDMAEHLAIRHPKTLQQQIKQNQKYAKIMGQV